MKGRQNLISSKRLVSTIAALVVLVTVTICLLNIVGAVTIVQVKTNSNTIITTPIQLVKKGPLGPNPRGIVWDVQVNLSETAGKVDNAVFGEATDANDGPPADSYDTMKPPAPPTPPYLRAWFNDNLPTPYNTLWKDYRNYPETSSKVWNLSVQWIPTDYSSPTDVTLTWSSTAINLTEYDSIMLCTSGGTPLKNMLLYNTYSFTCPAMVPQNFKIICHLNQPPVVSGIPDQTIAEGSTFSTIALDDYVSDVDNLDSEMTWTYSGNTALTVSISGARVATITIPNLDWNGAETITFRATDSGSLWDDDAAIFTVTNINDAPVVTDIPDQTIAEGSTFATISLDDYVSDVDNTDAQMTWTYSGNTALTVSISGARVATITIPNADWNGAETITFRATDSGSLWDDDAAVFTVTAVNDPPVVVGIPDQTIAEGSTFATISLDDYVSDVDNLDSEMTWTYSGNTALMVSISGARVATITIPNLDWNGAETITFRATDSGSLWDDDAAVFTVTAVNDPPVVVGIPDQTIAEGSTFGTISLDDYVSDVDNLDSEMTWTYSGNTALTVSISGARVATITIPNLDWNGAETITFRATDSGSLWDDDAAIFTVTNINDAPVVTDIPDQTIAEGSTFATISLDDYVSDVDNTDAQMTWTYSGNTALTVSISGARVATITIPNADWNGAETITFRATDSGSLWDDDAAVFTVTAVNDPPVVVGIPDQTIAEGSTFATISLDDYVSDVDNTDAQMTWTYSGNSQLTVSIVARVATITIPNADWYGSETITFRATDSGSLWDDDAAIFTVTNINDAPVVVGIPDQTIAEGSTFATISLDDYVSDVDNTDAQMTWTYSGNSQLTVSIVARVATITIPNADWYGSETITFRATDSGSLWDDDAAVFTVTAVNDPPVVVGIPDQTIAEGSTFATISLDDYVSDVDNTDAQMTWTYSGNSQLTVSIVARVATITIPNADWYGSETITFRATDSGSLWDDDAAVFTVTAVNDPPVVVGIPDQTIAEGSTFATISLDNYVSDVDNTDAQMTWTYSGNSQLTVSIVARVATITIPNADWYGSETITFRATDSGSLWDDDAAVFTVTAVNDPPVVVGIPDQTIAEGSTFATISLDDYVSDVDNTDAQMTWTYSGNTALTVSISGARVATITIPNLDWNGAETITFRATDSGSLWDDDAAIFTVTNINDAPVVTDIPDQTIIIGSIFSTITLDDYVSDVDNTDAQMTWTYSGNTALMVSISGARVATITIPNANWYGSETITFKATDPGSLWDDDAATFTVYAKLNITTVQIGWNFISIPFNQTITKANIIVIYQGTEYNWAQAVAAGHIVDTIFQWNRSAPQHYWPTDTLKPGEGYWLFAYHTCNIWATNLSPMNSTNFVTNLYFEWNLFGIPVNQTVSKTSLIVNYEGVDYNWTQATTNQNPTNWPLVISTLFGWKRTTPQGYILSDILDPGYCYWIYAYHACTLKRST